MSPDVPSVRIPRALSQALGSKVLPWMPGLGGDRAGVRARGTCHGSVTMDWGFPGSVPTWTRLLWGREFPELAWNCWEFSRNVGREEFQRDSRMAAAPPIPWIQSCWRGWEGSGVGTSEPPSLGDSRTPQCPHSQIPGHLSAPFPDSRTFQYPFWEFQDTSVSLWGLQDTSVSPFPDSRTPQCPFWEFQATSVSLFLVGFRDPPPVSF